MDLEIIRNIIKYAVRNARQITSDTEALEVSFLFKEFKAQIGREITKGEYIQHNGILYKVLLTHTIQEHWEPNVSPSLFAEVLTDPSGGILDWKQPDSTNAYMKGDKVKFEGKIYESLIDSNIWSPSAYPAGWQEVI